MPPFADPSPPDDFLFLPIDALLRPAAEVPDLSSLASASYALPPRPLDAGTGLQYDRARYYCAAPGAWASEDPLALSAADRDLYRYPGAEPPP